VEEKEKPNEYQKGKFHGLSTVILREKSMAWTSHKYCTSPTESPVKLT